ncbi:MAG: ribonuclease P protein component [Armatimonadetes bacterium]|nr:ribonuclease P protein component [Armatimonadota bacterium]
MNCGPTKKQFEKIYREGSRAAGRICRLLSLPGTGKIGVSTLRAFGSKPRRNVVKRRMKAAIGNPRTQEWLGFDWVVQATRDAEKASVAELRDDIFELREQLLRRWQNN